VLSPDFADVDFVAMMASSSRGLLFDTRIDWPGPADQMYNELLAAVVTPTIDFVAGLTLSLLPD